MEKCVICISEKTCETERHIQRETEKEIKGRNLKKNKQYKMAKIISRYNN